ncbi:MAG: bifunctional oligoribonuclease/PAP phosphatase NrnA [Candidatus Sumerlaeia bacterium]|nr:bifunctional oligoribonuclease/PAP phosphatase NrnA [Candidatus Sumerlaeia bacterium]
MKSAEKFLAGSTPEVLSKIVDVIRAHYRFLICGHVRPDGDCLGSALGLYFVLRQLDKIVEVCVPGPILEHYFFLPGIEVIKPTPDNSFHPEVTIFVDASNVDRVLENFVPQGIVINIDHHQTNEVFGDLNYIDPKACAVGEQIYNLTLQLGVTPTPEIVNNLYLAILADTGGFRFSNTNSRTFEIAAHLCKLGVDPAYIAREFFANRSAESVRLAAEVMQNLHFEFDGKFVWAEITQEIYQRYGGEQNEPESLVGEMRAIKGVAVSVLLHELAEGGLRAGLRSKDVIDVSRLAEKVGGGGHKNAAGCYIRGDSQTLKQKLLTTFRSELAILFSENK